MFYLIGTFVLSLIIGILTIDKNSAKWKKASITTALVASGVLLFIKQMEDNKKQAEFERLDHAFKKSSENADKYQNQMLDSLNAKLNKFGVYVMINNKGQVVVYKNQETIPTPPPTLDTAKKAAPSSSNRDTVAQITTDQNLRGVGGQQQKPEVPLIETRPAYPEYENVSLKDGECKTHAVGGGWCHAKYTFINAFDEPIELYQAYGVGTKYPNLLIQPGHSGTTTTLEATYNYDGQCVDSFRDYTFYFRIVATGKPTQYFTFTKSVYPCLVSKMVVGPKNVITTTERPR